RLRMTASGSPGHASVPLPETAFRNLGIALERMHAWEPAAVITPPMRAMLTAIAEALGGEEAAAITTAIDSDPPGWPRLAQMPISHDERLTLYAQTHDTVVPTMI